VEYGHSHNNCKLKLPVIGQYLFPLLLISLLLQVVVEGAWVRHTARRVEEEVVLGHLLAHQAVGVVQNLH
jgi:hypothetical protein